MKHVKLMGLCLIAMFAFGALGVSVAQAEETPEWGHCLHIVPSTGKEQKKGNYTDKNCTEVAVKIKVKKVKGVIVSEEKIPDHKGGYEWFGGAGPLCYKQATAEYTYKNKECTEVAEKTTKGVTAPDHKGKYEKMGGGKFKGAGEVGVLDGKVYDCENEEGEFIGPLPKADCFGYDRLGVEITCETEKASGEAVGTDEIKNVAVRFTGCLAFATDPVTSEGLEPGEIETYKLDGRLGYISKSHTPEPEVGVLLQPEAPHGLFAKFDFNGAEVVVGEGNKTEGSFYESTGPGDPTGNDGIISPIEPVNAMTPTFTQDYTRGTGVESKYENIPQFETGPTYLLEDRQHGPNEELTTDWGPASEKITNVNTLEEGEAEIKG